VFVEVFLQLISSGYGNAPLERLHTYHHVQINVGSSNTFLSRIAHAHTCLKNLIREYKKNGRNLGARQYLQLET
jgi:hypothetical protein